MPSLQQLFVQVVEAGSFKQAAEQMQMEPSSLSRKIAALEQHLNVRLLHRSTRHTHPTELGQRYYAGLFRSFVSGGVPDEARGGRIVPDKDHQDSG
ncbi:LysR family transcriptional regulator [Synechococcus sp. CS-602]|uniref:helix-turn-helix domain-containing protein n=1 Tax=unclassified Synechococcus TaxID=2626047 RepID=UPI0008FF74EC|nr:LysR family transcriptional regulator [Synechococcus sp. CS-603]MCT0204053.1 LysR family transcriptional regulator [Synechococcus sp. CS-602]MCT0246625.1 LysR family transcriptional regulator [Synechococcus sp. CS-601]TWB93841.1 regulatory helix-turn-helix LysR family protein [Synechococcus sp. Ace-Pa]